MDIVDKKVTFITLKVLLTNKLFTDDDYCISFATDFASHSLSKIIYSRGKYFFNLNEKGIYHVQNKQIIH